MGRCRFATVLMSLAGSPPMEVRWRPAAKKSAVEKAGAWKPAKTKSRFPPAPTLPWKSRKLREIPTFPPRRLRFVWENRKPRRRPKGRVALLHKADRSRVNKTGQIDLLTTGDSKSVVTSGK